ncbi:MAG TPA: monovalent cation/H(+) antiporter subunit G [Terracidiphilus sp.]
MTVHQIVVSGLLVAVVLACWIGALGTWSMSHPIQSLHYLALPATAGIGALTLAVFMETGLGATSMKTLLIALVILAFNSVVTHATARAFRARELGHWEPLDGDPMEFVPSTHHPARSEAEPADNVEESRA